MEARLGVNRTFIATKAVYGNNRRKAVKKAVQWFWKDFNGILGPAHEIITINDPFEEVNYNDSFACNDLANKYLDQKTLERVLEQANGDLIVDDRTGSKNQPPNSLRRVKRRRKENKQLTPRLYQTPRRTIYYKMTEPSQESFQESKRNRLDFHPKAWKRLYAKLTEEG